MNKLLGWLAAGAAIAVAAAAVAWAIRDLGWCAPEEDVEAGAEPEDGAVRRTEADRLPVG